MIVSDKDEFLGIVYHCEQEVNGGESGCRVPYSKGVVQKMRYPIQRYPKNLKAHRERNLEDMPTIPAVHQLQWYVRL